MTEPSAADVWMGALPPVRAGGLVRPRIGIAGISIESSTFSPHVSGEEAFTVRVGDELLQRYPFLRDELAEAADWVPLLHGRSLPGGAVDPATYATMKSRILAMVAAEGPFDGFLLDIHGAMSVLGMTDAEADLAGAVREALGPDTLVSATMDLHGNVSRALLDAVDLITCYRMAPHEDEVNTKERAAHNLVACLRRPDGSDPARRRPWKAWLQIPVLLPGEKTSTRVEPARDIYNDVASVAALPDVLDASLWVGYAWADEPRCQAAVVVTGWDRALIRREAERLAGRYWDARDDFVFVGPAAPFDECLDDALARGAARPFVISDSGDNPTAGGAGDVTWTLHQLVADERLREGGPVVLCASVFDEAAVEAARRAGQGTLVDLQVGANVDAGPAGPVRLRGVVEAIAEGDPVAGTQVVVRCGSVRAIVTEHRKPFHFLSDFTSLGLDPGAADVVVVKIGYLEPELHRLAADWRLALTPGGVDQDLLRLGHHNLAPGTHPFDHRGPEPELKALVTRRGEA